MRLTLTTRRAAAIAAALLAGVTLAHSQPVGTAFTYQGRLTDAGNPATGTYDLQLALFDAASAGGQVGPTLTRDDVVVTDGLFTATVDFGAVFTGSKRWLEIRVRPGAGAGAYTTLAGRQELTPSPHAAFASGAPWAGVAGKPAGFADDVDDDSGGDVTGVTAGSGLTGGGTSGDLALAVDLQGSGTAASVARSDHDHLAQAWSGSAQAFQALHVTNTATGGFSDGIFGQANGTGGARGVVGYAPGAAGNNYGVWGQADSTGGRGVFGLASAFSGSTYGIHGQSDSTAGRGVFGQTTATTGTSYGVYGENASTTGGAGVFGRALGTGPVSGIEGRANTPNGNAIYAQNDATTGGIGVAARGNTAIYGEAVGNLGGTGVYGIAPQVGGDAIGVRAQTQAQTGKALWAISSNANGVNYALYAENAGTNSYAGYFTGLPGFGRVHVTGTLSKGMGSFKIDHPLDPANKYLYHSFVESPDMMNIYNGTVVTDADGYATVEMPEWFEALNRQFRYQLTVVDEADTAGFVQVKVVRKVAGNRFTLRTSAPRVEVSWQVTGVRHDAIAEKHRIPVEQDKPEAERGKYLYPVEHGQPAEKGVDWERSEAAERLRKGE